MAKVFLGLGGNVGDAKQTLKDAIICLAQNPHIEVTSRSCYYKSEPINASGDDFVNSVISITTSLDPLTLLKVCQSVEDTFGRERPFPNAPRTIDIDILTYDQLDHNQPELTIPHPRMVERLFVLLPLLEIEPEIALQGVGPLKDLVKSLTSQRIEKIQGCQCPNLSGF
jgi:2-amino-4-hydroxy-6-hydroxymethyldihydropteridine diphosphokinase